MRDLDPGREACRGNSCVQKINLDALGDSGSGVVEVSIGDMVERVQAATGTNKPVVRDDARLRPEGSEVRALVADYSRLQAACGWTPVIDLDDGVARTVEWWRGRIESGRIRRSADYLT